MTRLLIISSSGRLWSTLYLVVACEPHLPPFILSRSRGVTRSVLEDWYKNPPNPLQFCLPYPSHVCSQLYHPEFCRWRGQPTPHRCCRRGCHPRDSRCLLCTLLQRRGARVPQAEGHPTLPCLEFLPTAVRLPPLKFQTEPRKELLFQRTPPQHHRIDRGRCSPSFLLQPTPQLLPGLQDSYGCCTPLPFSRTAIELSIDPDNPRHHVSAM